ncbi:hypothetical protein A2773_07070 [Candidatus Gottesmanbacteria bacterium RIFCSPHIGHO2_01_FULL_39_10]|uniref:Cardiolipin synthase N-terminal domain-containing protein n=1 Tax=Candidatus Gottesmanbacteria bacterium RIFCSPHIGHO2_01_FULL_39_10 TaxID=1798375 RepID=A0A1F5ZR70_9BACT|nr:MAG: hypothetical protein A2773_07070 [Candidatus Gottesmanbacteria bacterium RIFCSPHIGHO2_01_FULL_39_10]
MEIILGLLLNVGIFFVSLIVFAPTIFWILMLIDAIKRDYTDKNDKILWVLVIIFASFIGALIYYFMIKAKAKKGTGIEIKINNIITITFLLTGAFFPLGGIIGILLMWFWTNWPKNWKIIISLIFIALTILIYGSIFLVALMIPKNTNPI